MEREMKAHATLNYIIASRLTITNYHRIKKGEVD